MGALIPRLKPGENDSLDFARVSLVCREQARQTKVRRTLIPIKNRFRQYP